jgi:hypothetical protein
VNQRQLADLGVALQEQPVPFFLVLFDALAQLLLLALHRSQSRLEQPPLTA